MDGGQATTLQRRLGALIALCAVTAFLSGAGLAAPALIPVSALLVLSLFWQPGERVRRALELGCRAIALVLAVRATLHAVRADGDIVLPMVDLLLVLLLAESYRSRAVGGGEARLYSLTFALLIAAAAYRPGSLFALAFAAYLALLTVSLIVGQLAGQARAWGLRPPRLPRGFLLQSAALSVVAIGVSLVVFLAFPRVSWGARGAPPLRHVVGFSDRVSLLEHGARLYSNPDVILRVEFPGRSAPPPGPLYWRGRSYDRFDGGTWSRTPTRPQALIETRRWPKARVEQLIYQAAIGDANVLFGLSPLLHVQPRSRIVAYAEANGDFTYGGPASPVYVGFSALGEPDAQDLREAVPLGDPLIASYSRVAATEQAMLRPYLRLPPLGQRFYRLADSLAAPYGNDYDRARAVQGFLQTFRYTIELPATEREATLEHFLFERRAGHCEYFSTAMAMLLRAMAVPARNVNGFLGGEWNEFGDFLTVTQNQAHSWVEVWFAGYGWVRFDPTPAAASDLVGRAAGARWLTPFRQIFAGLEHRWGKWVLDYDLDDQSRLLARASGRSAEPGAAPTPDVSWRYLVTVVLALVLGLRLLARRRGRHGRPAPRSHGAATREYLRLRRAYSRAGYHADTPPLTFLEQLRQANAPAVSQAAGAIQLYARLRFGPAAGGTAERRLLHEQVRAVRRELWRVRRSRFGRRNRRASAPSA